MKTYFIHQIALKWFWYLSVVNATKIPTFWVTANKSSLLLEMSHYLLVVIINYKAITCHNKHNKQDGQNKNNQLQSVVGQK